MPGFRMLANAMDSPTPQSVTAGDGTEPAGVAVAVTSRKAVVKKLAKLAIAAVILALLFTQVRFVDVVAAIRGADAGVVAAAFGVVMFMQWWTAHRLKLLIDAHGLRLPTLTIFDINLATLFYGLFLPGGNFTGIAIRFYRLSKEQQSAMQTGVALFMDRIIATITLLAAGIGFWLIDWPTEQGAALAFMALGAVALLVLLMLLFGRAEVPVVAPMRRLLLGFGGKKLASLRSAMLDQAAMKRGKLALVFLLSCGVHVLGVLAYWMLAQSMGIELSWVTIGWVRSTMILATMIPLSVSGLGLREGATIAVLAQFGNAATEADAMAYSLLVFGATILAVGLVGGLFEAKRLLT